MYKRQALDRVAFIRHCRDLDMSLAEIGRILVLSEQPEADCDEINEILDSHLVQVRTRKEALSQLENQLISLRSRCNSHRKAADCGILQDLFTAASDATCGCHPKR